MKNDNYLDTFSTKEKAIHHAHWMNFKYRVAKIISGIISGPDDNYSVCEEITAQEMQTTFLDILSNDYTNLTYKQIENLRIDKDPAKPWEEINGLFSTADGEILRYIIKMKIPLEKLIRYELASRGHDENHRWCGYEKAKKIWMKK